GSAPTPPPGVEVSGKIHGADGAPLTCGILVLRPNDGVYGATGEIQADGSFTLVDAKGNKSVVPGSYQVYVVAANPSQEKQLKSVPARYRNSEAGDSDVEVKIQEPTTSLKIALKR
ncbi:MAG: hypothetical protein NZO58_07960, partial [Gemmataceae bacterium]|nr:hypothetical protein [Gemmataceae bacterium]